MKRNKVILILPIVLFLILFSAIIIIMLSSRYSIEKVQYREMNNKLLIYDENYKMRYQLPVEWMLHTQDTENWNIVFRKNDGTAYFRYYNSKFRENEKLPYTIAQYMVSKQKLKEKEAIQDAVKRINILTSNDLKDVNADFAAEVMFKLPENSKIYEYIYLVRKKKNYYFFSFIFQDDKTLKEIPDYIKLFKTSIQFL